MAKEVTEFERTENYIKFQIAELDEILTELNAKKAKKPHYAAFLAKKNALERELSNMYRTRRELYQQRKK